ncbi:MAG: hypothetical protein V1774_12050 [Candidatus Eisenbacteria bacterium]
MRRIWLLPLVCLLAWGIGCRSRTAEPLTQVTRSPAFHPESLEAVAYFGFSPGIAPDNVLQWVEALVGEQLMTVEYPFAVLSRTDVERLTQTEETRTLVKGVCNFWKDSRKVDKFELARLCEAVGVQGILVGTIEEWTEAASARGTTDVPYTRLAASLEFYSAESGRRTWKARSAHTIETQATQEDYEELRDKTQKGRERLRAETVQAMHRDHPAPSVESVAATVAEALAKALVPGGAS